MPALRAIAYLLNCGLALGSLWLLDRGELAAFPEIAVITLAAANVILLSRAREDDVEVTSRAAASIIDLPLLALGVLSFAAAGGTSARALAATALVTAVVSYLVIAEPWQRSPRSRLTAPIAMAIMLFGLVFLLGDSWAGPLVFGGNTKASLFTGATLVAFGAVRAARGRTVDELTQRRSVPGSDDHDPDLVSIERRRDFGAKDDRVITTLDLPAELVAELRAAARQTDVLGEGGLAAWTERALRARLQELRNEHNAGRPFVASERPNDER